MKSRIIIPLAIGIFILIVCLIACSTHILTISQLKNNALLPTYDSGQWIIASKWKKFSYNDIVYYQQPSAEATYGYQRIAGLEGDVIEICDGYLLRNGFIVHATNEIIFSYFIPRRVVRNLTPFNKLKTKPYIQGDSIILSLSSSDYKELSPNFLLHKLNKNKNQKDAAIAGSTARNCWNAYNYGPVIVPKGHCFLLANARSSFLTDSRHIGFIPIENIRATVLWKE